MAYGGNPFDIGAKQQYELGQREAQQAAAAQQASNPRPGAASYTSALGADNQLSDAYKLKAAQVGPLASNVGQLDQRLSGIQLDKTGLNEIQNRALTKGPSAWATMAGQQADVNTAQQKSQAGAAGAGAQADARAGLAMRGGLSGGARERLAMGGANNQMNNMQSINAQNASAKGNIGLQDEQQKQSMLMQLPGMQLASLQPEMQKAGAWQSMAQQEQGLTNQNNQYNTGAQNQAAQTNMQNTLGAISQKNDQAQNQYNEQMKSWASEQQARATEKSGQK